MKYIIDYGMGYYHDKLGDAIVYCSAFQHFGDIVWRQKAKSKPTSVWRQVAPMFKPFKLKVQHGKPTRSDKNFMHEMWKEGVKIPRAKFTPVEGLDLPERFATYQLSTGFSGRDMLLGDLLKHTGDIPLINLDDITAIRDEKSVSRLLTVQSKAEFHIGPDSGCAWSAIAAGIPTKVFHIQLAEPKRQMMHECALRLMSNNDNVTIIKEGK